MKVESKRGPNGEWMSKDRRSIKVGTDVVYRTV